MKTLIFTITLLIAFNITYADNPPVTYQKLKHEVKTMRVTKDFKKPVLTSREKAIIGAGVCAVTIFVQTIWIKNKNQIFFKTIPYVMAGTAIIQLIFMETSERRYR
jgi:hypothetical protein